MSDDVPEAGPRTNEPDLRSDLVWGGEGIAQEINRTTRQAFHMLENGLLPARKVGGVWCASRTALRRALIGQVS
jgi:hypothetical protein